MRSPQTLGWSALALSLLAAAAAAQNPVSLIWVDRGCGPGERIVSSDMDGAGWVQRGPTGGPSQAPRGLDVDDVNEHIYIAGSDGITRVDLQDAGNRVVVLSPPGGDSCFAIAVDLAGGKIYYSQIGPPHSVRRCNLNGTGVEVLVDTGALGSVKGMFEMVGVGGGEGVGGGGPNVGLSRADLDGSNVEFLHTLTIPAGLDIDFGSRWAYWLKHDGLHRTHLDTGVTENLLSPLSGYRIEDIQLDLAGGKVYWTEVDFPTASAIRRADLDGSNPETLHSGPRSCPSDAFETRAIGFSIHPYVAPCVNPTITTTAPAAVCAGDLPAALAASGGTPPYTWSGVPPGGLTLDASGTFAGAATTSGSFSATVTDDLGCFDTQTVTLAVNPAPSVTTASLPAVSEGGAYSEVLAATGGTPAFTWSVAVPPLPAGLSLSAGGTISGTATTAGTYNFDVQVTDSAGCSDTRSLSIVVSSLPQVDTTSLPDATQGLAYNEALAATGGTSPLSWAVSSGALPPGLTLEPSTGVISGTASALGTFSFEIQVTDSLGGSGTPRALSITVSPVMPGTSPSSRLLLLLSLLSCAALCVWRRS